KHSRTVGALYVANEGIRTDEPMTRVFGYRADDPAKHAVINRSCAQLNETFRREIIYLRRAGQNRGAIEISSVSRRNRIQFLVSFSRERLRRIDHPNGEPHSNWIVREISVARIEHVVLPFVWQKRIEDRTVRGFRKNKNTK